MKLSVRELNSALNACKREKGPQRLIDDLAGAIEIALENKVQEVEVRDDHKMIKLVKELAGYNEEFVRTTQFGRR